MTFSRSATRSGRAALLGCTAIISTLALPGLAQAQNAGAAPDQPNAPAPQPTGTVDTATNTPTGVEPGPAAQTPGAPPVAAEGSNADGLQEIVVTAQRREQRLQDVPIAITAITSDRLQANRVVSVTDLSGLAPNVTVRPSAGASQSVSFTSRGITSYGVVPGSDKEFSIYLDGVYIGSSRSLFDLPDIERIEVLRGPQGTLFGRNSTSGAVGVITRDPTGTFGVHQDFTYGNYDQFRSRTSIDTPSLGAFSGYISYIHDERRGDIRNSGAGTVWDRTGPNTRSGVQTSPRYLGDRNQEQVFAAVKFEPSDTFKTVYKFDYTTLNYTAGGTAPLVYRPEGVTETFTPALGALAPLFADYFNTIVAANNPAFATSAKRPKTVNNAWVVPSRQHVYGHNLTSSLELSDNLSVKNIASYRKSFVNSSSQLTGLGGLTVPASAALPYATFLAATGQVPGVPANFLTLPAATQAAIASGLAASPAIQALAGVGGRLSVTDNNTQSREKQYSDELQFNYNSQLLTLTVGGLYFHQTSTTGGPPGIVNTPAFRVFPASGRIPLGGQSLSTNKGTSIAAYSQGEIHVTPKFDVVLGGRVTRDKKSGHYLFGGTYVPPAGATLADANYYTGGTFTGINDLPFTFKETNFTYSAGVNYKPTSDLLFYAKYSTGFVSGGSIAGIDWQSEKVGSAEAGIKADLFDRRVRANLAVFHAKYKNIQSAQGGTNVGRPEVGTAIIDLGDERAQGAELELTVVPVRNVTLGGNIGFTDAKYTNLTPLILSIYGTGYKPTLLPKYTSSLYGQYRSEPFSGDARFTARVDADWRSRVRFISGSTQLSIPEYVPFATGPARWIVNTRVGLEDIGPMHMNVAFWTRNLTNNKDRQFPLVFASYALSADFQLARTYGLDVSLRF